MRKTKTLKASTSHVWEKYTFVEEEFTASYDELDKGWSISHPVLGCSKNRETPEEALRNVLYEHGCSDITIHEETTTQKGNETMTTKIRSMKETGNRKVKKMSKIETVEVTAEAINKELVKAVKTDAKVARKLVLEVHPFAANIIWKETNGAWPTKSLTVKMIDASQTLQDMFVGLSQADRSNHVRDIKFVSENFDEVVAEGETNGWRKIDAMRKAIQKAQKAEEKASQEATEDTGEATEEATEEATKEATEELPTITINDIMSAIMRNIPEATTAQLLRVAEDLDVWLLGGKPEELTGQELLDALGDKAFASK
tara:strand:+ start:269 stop:1210 length:942 start_codon:yes stop_codon:yes gene_type:complete